MLILGDTNSGLAAIVARRLGIPVYHMEAGNRCYDDRVPEEVNRRVIDHSSSVLLPYTNRSRENLLREGIPGDRIHVIGNPIKQVIDHNAPQIAASTALADLKVSPGKYFLVTLHRAENVDGEARLRRLVDALAGLHERYGHPVITSLHPRTKARIEEFGVKADRKGLRWMEPLGFFDFIRLEQEAFCVLTDSGTVQEETCLFGVPNVTIRDVTERPETVDVGSNVLAGSDHAAIADAVHLVTSVTRKWTPPAEYLVEHVAETVTRIVLGYREPDLAEIAWVTGADDEPRAPRPHLLRGVSSRQREHRASRRVSRRRSHRSRAPGQRDHDTPHSRPDPGAKVPDVRIIRIPVPRKGTSALRNALIWLVYLVGSFWAGMLRGKKPDVVLAVTPPPGIGLIGSWVARRYKAKLVYNVKELYPDVAVALGVLDARPSSR